MRNLLQYIKTLYKLGLNNVAYVAWYRFTLKTGWRKHKFVQRAFQNDTDFFSETQIHSDFPEAWKAQLITDADKIVKGELRFYAFHWKKLGNPPNWFLNPFNNAVYPNTRKHWTDLPDFLTVVGDIKNVWEASRFEWVVTLARAYAVSGDVIYLKTLNAWLKNWTSANPLNTGPNWKCGQEASIRLFILLNASFILNQHKEPSPAVIEFIYHSLNRISKNIHYAIAQNNNHGTSEAAGLFIGGLWLKTVAPQKYPEANAFTKKGRYWLENRVRKLVSDSGSFSQHSITYHRVMLDTLCFAELWRNKLQDNSFSNHFYRKAKAATNWLYHLTDDTSGNAPNTGSNDGAMFLNLHSCGYRDFRPTLQMAANIFFNTTWFDNDSYDEPLFWFKLNRTKKNNPPIKENFSVHGFAALYGDNSWALIKWPYYKFRPSHNDVLHVDIWHKGKNLLCDAGSYSYNSGEEFPINLKSVHFHNSVSFDGREQMPKLSRFLLGEWTKIQNAELVKNHFKGRYEDSYGNSHERVVEFVDNNWIITDILSGNFSTAILGFNINDHQVSIVGNNIIARDFQIIFSSDGELALKTIPVSQYYWEKSIINRLELKVNKEGTYKTIIKLLD